MSHSDKSTTDAGQYTHLKEGVAKAFSLPDRERMQLFDIPIWIGYPRAKAILDKLEDLMDMPRLPRPPSTLIVGNTNNGKTAIAHRFLAKHPPVELPNADAKQVPVVYVECPSKPEEKRLLETLITAVGGVIPDTSSISALERSLDVTYAKIGVKLIIIDEIHNVLTGSPAQQRLFLTVIKGISNRTRTPIVVIGIQTAFHLFTTDEQTANRFDPEALPKWGHGDDYINLLISCERLLPLKNPSGLRQPDLANEILVQSDGLLGEMFKLFSHAGKAAIKDKSERLTVDLIRSCGYRSPSERKTLPI